MRVADRQHFVERLRGILRRLKDFPPEAPPGSRDRLGRALDDLSDDVAAYAERLQRDAIHAALIDRREAVRARPRGPVKLAR